MGLKRGRVWRGVLGQLGMGSDDSPTNADYFILDELAEEDVIVSRPPLASLAVDSKRWSRRRLRLQRALRPPPARPVDYK
jgi:hypothetical protein